VDVLIAIADIVRLLPLSKCNIKSTNSPLFIAFCKFITIMWSARWVYELLRAGAGQISDTEAYGFRLKPDWQRFSLEEIKQFLDQDFFTLSSAHYERYISHQPYQ
jgi:hypothetical protein